MQLYSYYRSSAAYRVRIALAYKSLKYECIPIHLVKDGGLQHREDYKKINPQQLVPTLIDDKYKITQSLAILEYLEERFPNPSILPKEVLAKARVRSLAQAIACDIHPLNNLRVLQYLKNELNISDEQKDNWYQHWIHHGFSALEIELASNTATGLFCHGNTPTIADLCLIPQVYNALRFNIMLEDFPTIKRIYEECMTLASFQSAAPESQPDAQ